MGAEGDPLSIDLLDRIDELPAAIPVGPQYEDKRFSIERRTQKRGALLTLNQDFAGLTRG